MKMNKTTKTTSEKKKQIKKKNWPKTRDENKVKLTSATFFPVPSNSLTVLSLEATATTLLLALTAILFAGSEPRDRDFKTDYP